jgi:pimeloyl-ACP methyl ester carboxylesterase
MLTTRMETISIDDTTRIEAVVRGQGAAVVLIPGLALDASMFENLCSDLANNGYRAIAINMRGTAGSVGPMENITLHDLASDVAAVIGALSDKPVHVVGNAFGNRVARCLAVDHPDLVISLTLLAAGGLTKIDPTIMEAMQKLLHPDTTEKEKLEAAKFALVAPQFDPTPVLQLQWWPTVVRPFMLAEQSTPVTDWWSGGSAPILVIQGMLDKIAPPENAQSLQNEFGERVEIVELPDTGHAVLFEQRDAVTQTIVSFLKKNA